MTDENTSNRACLAPLPSCGRRCVGTSSANYALNWSVVGSGGGEMISASYAMQSTVGQTAIETASGNYRLEAGYWSRVTVGEPGICGDLDSDGKIMTADAMIALEITAGSRPFDAAADVDGDGMVTARCADDPASGGGLDRYMLKAAVLACRRSVFFASGFAAGASGDAGGDGDIDR